MNDYFHVEFTDKEIQGISNLGLAHLGDGVFELLVRVWLCKHGRATAAGLHHEAVAHVNAAAQAEAAEKLTPYLTVEELAVFKRGRNTKVGSVPKNSSLQEYHAATGLEALFGYLFLRGRLERINELFEKIMGE